MGNATQMLVASPQSGAGRQSRGSQKMGIDIADAKAEQFMTVDKVQHLLM